MMTDDATMPPSAAQRARRLLGVTGLLWLTAAGLFWSLPAGLLS